MELVVSWEPATLQSPIPFCRHNTADMQHQNQCNRILGTGAYTDYWQGLLFNFIHMETEALRV